jgi:hypothetical protein
MMATPVPARGISTNLLDDKELKELRKRFEEVRKWLEDQRDQTWEQPELERKEEWRRKKSEHELREHVWREVWGQKLLVWEQSHLEHRHLEQRLGDEKRALEKEEHNRRQCWENRRWKEDEKYELTWGWLDDTWIRQWEERYPERLREERKEREKLLVALELEPHPKLSPTDRVTLTFNRIKRVSSWAPSPANHRELIELLGTAQEQLDQLRRDEEYHADLREFMARHRALCSFIIDNANDIAYQSSISELIQELRRLTRKLRLTALSMAEGYESLYKSFIANRDQVSDILDSASAGQGTVFISNSILNVVLLSDLCGL